MNAERNGAVRGNKGREMTGSNRRKDLRVTGRGTNRK
jgi:hypothetical protein